jgi:hypothetical protein
VPVTPLRAKKKRKNGNVNAIRKATQTTPADRLQRFQSSSPPHHLYCLTSPSRASFYFLLRERMLVFPLKFGLRIRMLFGVTVTSSSSVTQATQSSKL